MPGKVILVTSADIHGGAEVEFNRWYNEVHLPDVLACPGFVSSTRYECTDGQPRYLALYELEDERALTTPEMAAVRGWGDMFPHVRNFHERVYRMIHHADAPGGEDRPAR
jgi:hypothetical protein